MQLAPTAPRPRRGPAADRCIAALATIALAGCGASTLPTSAAQTSPTPAPSSIATPAPVPVPLPPLEGTDSAGNTILYNASGMATATLAAGSPDSVVSPLGNRLLAERSNAAHAVDALDAISADGSTQQLETIGDPAGFIDAIGARDGRAWAWMMKGTTNGCAGQRPPAATTNVYVASRPGSEALIAQLAPLSNGAQWMFYQWTAAGIVLTEGGPTGCSNGPRINTDPTDLLNPSTGSVTPLASRLGTGCVLQDMADNGTVVCTTLNYFKSQSPIAASATLLRIVSPSGRSEEVTAAQFLQGCSSPMGSPAPAFGDMSISGDGRYVSVTQWCNGQQTVQATTWVIDAQTLAVTQVSVAGIGAVEWLPGEDTLIATVANTNYGAPPPSGDGTYAVSPHGQATELTGSDIGSGAAVGQPGSPGGGLAHF